jgi:serine protease AprX
MCVCLSVAVSASLVVSGVASAKEKEQKIDQRLLAQVANVAPSAELSVIVVGPSAGASVEKQSGKKKQELSLLNAVSARVSASKLDELAGSVGVEFVAADTPLAPTGSVDPAKLLAAYPTSDGAPAAWQRGLAGKDVGIALIDSGIRRVDVDGVHDVPVPGLETLKEDKFGHGSLVAGVLAGRKDSKYVGIAHEAEIYSLNVNRPEGPRTSDVIKALEWVFNNAHKENIRVVNLSLQETVASTYQQSLLDLAVERVWAAGVLVVAAAGNRGIGAVDYAPANDPLVLTVGSTDDQGTASTADDSVASFSASGITTDGFAKPELLAPGRLIVSTLHHDLPLYAQAPLKNRVVGMNDYVSASGTSFSAPQVTGAAAILFQQHPDWSPDQVKWLLRNVARPVNNSAAGSLALDAAVAFTGTPDLANQGVPALVCAPNTPCIVSGSVGTVSSSWNSSSWNSSSWNSSSWNSSSWNSSSWNSGSWTSSSWNSSSWNSSSWNSTGWTSDSWD